MYSSTVALLTIIIQLAIGHHEVAGSSNTFGGSLDELICAQANGLSKLACDRCCRNSGLRSAIYRAQVSRISSCVCELDDLLEKPARDEDVLLVSNVPEADLRRANSMESGGCDKKFGLGHHLCLECCRNVGKITLRSATDECSCIPGVRPKAIERLDVEICAHLEGDQLEQCEACCKQNSLELETFPEGFYGTSCGCKKIERLDKQEGRYNYDLCSLANKKGPFVCEKCCHTYGFEEIWTKESCACHVKELGARRLKPEMAEAAILELEPEPHLEGDLCQDEIGYQACESCCGGYYFAPNLEVSDEQSKCSCNSAFGPFARRIVDQSACANYSSSGKQSFECEECCSRYGYTKLEHETGGSCACTKVSW